jgi:hypothetical protein
VLIATKRAMKRLAFKKAVLKFLSIAPRGDEVTKAIRKAST